MDARDVFISYSQPDHECALALVSQLEADGIGVWIAPRDISPSADWAAEIINAISAARLMVLVFSAHCNGSPQVLREVERATHKHVPVLPFRVQDVLPTASLEYFLSTRHWFDALPAPSPSHYVRLSRHISALLSGSVTIRTALASRTDLSTAATTTSQRALVPNFEQGELAPIQRALAYHVGPIARHLVQRAALKAADRDELTLLLAEEISPTSARQQFIDACKASAGRGEPIA